MKPSGGHTPKVWWSRLGRGVPFGLIAAVVSIAGTASATPLAGDAAASAQAPVPAPRHQASTGAPIRDPGPAATPRTLRLTLAQVGPEAVPPPAATPAGGTPPPAAYATPAAPGPAATKPFYKTWWFWTAVGAVTVATVLIVSHDDGIEPPDSLLGDMRAHGNK